jgi:hypothetical protein
LVFNKLPVTVMTWTRLLRAPLFVVQPKEGQVSSIHPVFVFVLILTFVHCLAQPACLGISWTFAVAMMISGL